jgi:glycosyltransferase involved in cell wall biosynthesis
MKIGIAGPVDIRLLAHLFPGKSLPDVYSFPLISKLIIELRKRGHEVTVFCGSHSITETMYVEGNGIKLYICPRRARVAYDFYRQERQTLTQAMNDSECEIIHAHWTYEFGVAALASNKKALVTAHDAPLVILSFCLRLRIFPHWFMRTLLGIRVMHTAPHLSAVSPYISRHIEKWYFPKKKVKVTPNGIEEEIFSVAKPPERATSAPPVIISAIVGWGNRKNASNALKAFFLFRKEFADAVYRIYGNDYETNGIAHQWAKSKGLDAGVEFCGKVPHDELLNFISESDVLLHPSLEESFGMSVCEAMALGIPVVGGIKSGAVPYVLDYGNAGVLVDVRSPSKIKEALCSLIKDPLSSKELGERGQRFVKANFTLTKMVDRYESVYHEILESGSELLDE